MSWTLDLYDDLMIDLFLDRQPDVARDVAFLAETLGRGRLLDQGCGVGTHALPLAERGFAVIGVDVVPGYVAEAKRRGAGTFECADAARFVTPCDGAYSFGSCIGHGTDEETRGVIASAHASLPEGGRYVIETLGAYGVLRHFERHSIVRGATRRGPVTLLRETRLDLAAGTMHKTWTFCLPGGHEERRESTLRFYAPHELVERVQAAGFVVEALLGGTHARPLTHDDSRLVLVARKESR